MKDLILVFTLSVARYHYVHDGSTDHFKWTYTRLFNIFIALEENVKHETEVKPIAWFDG